MCTNQKMVAVTTEARWASYFNWPNHTSKCCRSLECDRRGQMCWIPGTWHNSSTMNITIEEFCQHRKKKKSCQPLLKNSASIEKRKNCASHCWIIVPVTVEQLCQWLSKNRASHCWIIVPVTVKQSCQWLLNNHASNCWITKPVTVEQSCQWLNNCATDCWAILPGTVEHSCQWLLHIILNCWTIVPVTVEESY